MFLHFIFSSRSRACVDVRKRAPAVQSLPKIKRIKESVAWEDWLELFDVLGHKFTPGLCLQLFCGAARGLGGRASCLRDASLSVSVFLFGANGLFDRSRRRRPISGQQLPLSPLPCSGGSHAMLFLVIS